MQSSQFQLLSLRAKLAGAAFALVASLSSLAAVFAVFASASGELEPLLASSKPASAASAVVSKAPAKPVRVRG